MKNSRCNRFQTKLWALTLLLLPGAAGAQSYFTYSGTGDVLAGFRKFVPQGNYELVVNLGNITNFIAMPIGTQSNLVLPSASQLSDAFTNGYQNVQWSAFSTFSGPTPWVTPLGTYPQSTIWYTLPRVAAGTQTAAPGRLAGGSQGAVRDLMLAVGLNGTTLSQNEVTTNADNNTGLVREIVSGNASSILTAFIGDLQTNTIGDFQGQYFNANVENINPNTFTSATQSDLYQSVPSSVIGGRGAVTNIDPITGQTNGSSYYIGYFTFNTNGTMTFNRAATSTAPPAPNLTITSIGGTNTIWFTTTNGATYTLLYTNLPGITSARSNWFTLGSPITGNGGTTNFTDSTVTPGRIYTVTAH